MPYSNIAAAKKAGFNTRLDGAPLTLAQVNDLASMYDAIKKSVSVKEPMAVAITTFKKKYIKQGNKWVRRVAKQARAGLSRVKDVSTLPPRAQVIWNDVYQIVYKKLKKHGMAETTAKNSARRAAGAHINKYYDYDETTDRWRKKVK